VFVYVEYISRRPNVALADFRAIARRSQGGWAEQYERDKLLLNVGRTWRVGPEPEYVAVWCSYDAGIERLADWERAFGSGDADSLEKPMELAARLDRAGCYEPLLEPSAHRGGRYYAEYFDFADGTTREEIADYFDARRERSELKLPVLIDRIGKLGPDPRGLAFWVLSSYADLDRLAREVDEEPGAPIRLVTSALYAELGEEVL
jgi:hypothetical protein